MARKTKGGPGRRPGQPRPHTPTPPRRVATRAPAAELTIEERLAELEQERERLLAAASAAGVAEEEAVEEEAEAADDDADEEVAPQPAPARTSLPGARSRPGAAGSSAPPAPIGTRRVGRVAPAPPIARGPRPAAPRGVAPRAADALDPADPSIPLERVPYVQADLRRVAVIAGLMVLLIIVADIVVRTVVK
jgi:hypothetical protein